MTKILEVNTQTSLINGFRAKVNAYGWYNSIENHLQFSKRFILPDGHEVSPTSWKDAKLMAKSKDQGGLGFNQSSYFKLPNGQMVPTKYYLIGWMTHLWLVFLDKNPKVVEYAKQFDKFTDPYRGHSLVGVDTCVSLYAKEGRESLEARCWDFYGYIQNPSTQEFYERLKDSDLLFGMNRYVAEQVKAIGAK